MIEGDAAKKGRRHQHHGVTRKAGQTDGADAKTGATVAKYGAGVVGLAGAGIVLPQQRKAALSSSMFRFLFASKTGRNILLAASDQKVGSPAMRSLLDNAYQYANLSDDWKQGRPSRNDLRLPLRSLWHSRTTMSGNA